MESEGVILDADKISKGKSVWVEGRNKVYTRRFKKTSKNVVQDVVLAENSEKERALSPLVDILGEGDGNDENGVVREVVVRKFVDSVDGKVKINLKAVTSKNEIVELKERMKDELERVRSLGQKLEDKEAELTALSTVVVGGGSGGDVDGDGDGYSNSRYSGNDGVERRALVNVNPGLGRAMMRLNSEVASLTNSNLRPYQQLSVSVVDNNHHAINDQFVEKEKRTPKANQYYRNSDFLLGKDRLPPETNKRQKSNSGRKHSKDSGYGNNMFKSCSNLLQRLMKHKHGWVFNEPVNAKFLGLHDYHDIIKHPMDLGTIKSRLAQNFYKSPMEFADDVRLTFRNAMTYNPKGQDVHVMAEHLSNIFEEKWATMETESNQDWRHGMIYDASTPTPTSRMAPHFAHAPASAPAPAPARTLYRSESVSLPAMAKPKVTNFAPPIRTPVPKKPKARDPNKRNMTYEEKQKLSTNLQSLPSEKLDNIVQIIKKKNTELNQHDDEIEVDIDSVDVETLWELDRFVTNYRKSVSKHKKKAEQQARAGAGVPNMTLIENPVTFVPEVPNGNKTTGEKSLAGNAADLGERRGENARRSSSSSSSSSDSGSSSSDSDSESSSESDAGQSPRN